MMQMEDFLSTLSGLGDLIEKLINEKKGNIQMTNALIFRIHKKQKNDKCFPGNIII